MEKKINDIVELILDEYTRTGRMKHSQNINTTEIKNYMKVHIVTININYEMNSFFGLFCK